MSETSIARARRSEVPANIMPPAQRGARIAALDAAAAHAARIPVNGLTSGELRKLGRIRALATEDLAAAKAEASAWVLSNQRRRVLRTAACRTVKGLFSATPLSRAGTESGLTHT